MQSIESPDDVRDEHNDEGGGGEHLNVVRAPHAHKLWKKRHAAKNRVGFGEAINGMIVFARRLLFLADKVQHGESIAYQLSRIER